MDELNMESSPTITQLDEDTKKIAWKLIRFYDTHNWIRGRFSDGKGGHCIVGAMNSISLSEVHPHALTRFYRAFSTSFGFSIADKGAAAINDYVITNKEHLLEGLQSIADGKHLGRYPDEVEFVTKTP